MAASLINASKLFIGTAQKTLRSRPPDGSHLHTSINGAINAVWRAHTAACLAFGPGVGGSLKGLSTRCFVARVGDGITDRHGCSFIAFPSGRSTRRRPIPSRYVRGFSQGHRRSRLRGAS